MAQRAIIRVEHSCRKLGSTVIGIEEAARRRPVVMGIEANVQPIVGVEGRKLAYVDGMPFGSFINA
uniref:Uncharacterized protein n=1 Tax=Oryza meridionalis TaxID=40149 RepID=A0A0E0C052_9ORYZ